MKKQKLIASLAGFALILSGFSLFDIWDNSSFLTDASGGVSPQSLPTISYSGRLVDVDGAVMNGSKQLRFSVWDAESGDESSAKNMSNAKWYESIEVQVKNGIYNANLGQGNLLDSDLFSPASGESRYLQVEVCGLGTGCTPDGTGDWQVLDINTESASLERSLIGSEFFTLNSESLQGYDSSDFLNVYNGNEADVSNLVLGNMEINGYALPSTIGAEGQILELNEDGDLVWVDEIYQKNDDGTAICDAAAEGKFHYNTEMKILEFCDGTDWRQSSPGEVSATDLEYLTAKNSVREVDTIQFRMDYGITTEVSTINLNDAGLYDFIISDGVNKGQVAAGCMVSGNAGAGLNRTIAVTGCSDNLENVRLKVSGGTAKSSTGNLSYSDYKNFMVDNELPSVLDDYLFDNTWTNNIANISLSTSDGLGSGIQSGETRWCLGAADCTPSDPNAISLSANTNATLRYITMDNANNSSIIGDLDIKLDFDDPYQQTDKRNNFPVWLNSDNQTAYFFIRDDYAGLDDTYCTDTAGGTIVNDGGIDYCRLSCTISGEGENRTCSFAQAVCDKAGNCPDINLASLEADIDLTKPTVADDFAFDGNWTSAPKIITLTPQDTDGNNNGNSGIAITKYCKNSGGTDIVNDACTPNTATSTIDTVEHRIDFPDAENFDGVMCYNATDVAGNQSDTHCLRVMIDGIEPTQSEDYGAKSGVWQNTAQNVSLTGQDTSGSDSAVNYSKYCMGGTCNTGTGTDFSTVNAGVHSTIINFVNTEDTLKYATKDNGGNITEESLDIKVDTTPPSCQSTNYYLSDGVTSFDNSSWIKEDVVLKIDCSDNLSGCDCAGDSECTGDVYTRTMTANESDNLDISDVANNISQCPYVVDHIDKIAPSTLDVAAKNPPSSCGQIYFEVQSAIDELSGADSLAQYKFGAGGAWTNIGQSQTFLSLDQDMDVYFRDKAGNEKMVSVSGTATACVLDMAGNGFEDNIGWLDFAGNGTDLAAQPFTYGLDIEYINPDTVNSDAKYKGQVWSEDLGWIDFQDDDTKDFGGGDVDVREDAHSEGVGWVSLNETYNATDYKFDSVKQMDESISVDGFMWVPNTGWVELDADGGGVDPQ